MLAMLGRVDRYSGCEYYLARVDRLEYVIIGTSNRQEKSLKMGWPSRWPPLPY
jgi:hypothetical protein